MKLNNELRSLLNYLLSKRIFQRHKPKNKLVKRRTKWLNKQAKKEFQQGYKWLVNQGIIIEEKKRTGKGSDTHIRINPRKKKEASDLIRLKDI